MKAVIFFSQHAKTFLDKLQAAELPVKLSRERLKLLKLIEEQATLHSALSKKIREDFGTGEVEPTTGGPVIKDGCEDSYFVAMNDLMNLDVALPGLTEVMVDGLKLNQWEAMVCEDLLSEPVKSE